MGDSFHQNKVAVNNGITDKFPERSLLISFRQLDLVAVVSPTTGKILWYEYFDRQHDPDWLANGIVVYNNRSHFENSSIEFIDFKGQRQLLVGPEIYNWYRRATGNSQIHEDGTILFQGEENSALHIGNDKAIISKIEVANAKLRNAYYLTPTMFEKLDHRCNQIN